MILPKGRLRARLGVARRWLMEPLSAGLREYAERCRPYRTPGYAESTERIRQYADRHRGQRCVIIGNGPSLKQMDLSFLDNEISFGLNRIYLLTQERGLSVTYHVCVNALVLEQFGDEIQRMPCPKFISVSGYPHVHAAEDLMFINSLPQWGFSQDVSSQVWEGATVTYTTLQIAYYMGFDEVVLIGVDHSFSKKGTPNQEIVMDRPDSDHFDPSYFKPGVRWQLPDLEYSEISYRIAEACFGTAGRRVLDATVGGRLDVFPKVDYREHFGLA